MNKKPNVALVGVTGVVGSTFLKVLEERDFPFNELYMMASAKSAGKTILSSSARPSVSSIPGTATKSLTIRPR